MIEIIVGIIIGVFFVQFFFNDESTIYISVHTFNTKTEKYDNIHVELNSFSSHEMNFNSDILVDSLKVER